MERLILDVLLPVVALTWFFTESDGPWDVFERLRVWAGIDSDERGFFAKLLACGGCTATWAGMAVGMVQAFPYALQEFGFVYHYPLWLAWLVRGPLAGAGIVVVLDMLKPHPPFDLSGVLNDASG